MRRLLSRVMRPEPRECEEVRSLLTDFVDGELAEDERRRVERHLRFCRRCSTVLANFRRTLGRLRGLGEQPAASEDAVAYSVVRGWRDRA